MENLLIFTCTLFILMTGVQFGMSKPAGMVDEAGVPDDVEDDSSYYYDEDYGNGGNHPEDQEDVYPTEDIGDHKNPDPSPRSPTSGNTHTSHHKHHKIPPRLKELVQLLDEERYDRYHAAEWEQENGEPVTIGVAMYIESLSAFHSRDNSFDADLYLRKEWKDPRLVHSAPRHYTLNEPHLIRAIWKPDLYFANAKDTNMNSITKPNQMLKVFPDGRIQHSMKLSAKLVCHLKLQAYPVDSQECSIRILSYAHPKSELVLEWSDYHPMTYNEEISLPEMRIQQVNSKRCPGVYDNETFSCLEAEIKVKRNIAAHLIQTFLPSSLIVGISWISFWIDPHAVPARITLCFTTLLTLTTQAAGMRSSLPPVSYIKAIDMWMGFCTLMVLAAMVEYTYVNSLIQKAQNTHLRQKTKKRKRLEELLLQSNGSADTTMTMSSVPPDHSTRPLSFITQRSYTEEAYRIDSIARWGFPIVFLIVNIIYWSYLLTR